jgi:hypothetical protein
MSLIIQYWARQVVSNGSEQDRNVPCVHTEAADRARDPPGLQHYAHSMFVNALPVDLRPDRTGMDLKRGIGLTGG